ncbi:hypothetical protein BZA77DRAFT_308321 [Pyronema omphalodes]|nr:hypothetical protein BZA77DRAFT_308321 [Pyronema omphalodes]
MPAGLGKRVRFTPSIASEAPSTTISPSHSHTEPVPSETAEDTRHDSTNCDACNQHWTAADELGWSYKEICPVAAQEIERDAINRKVPKLIEKKKRTCPCFKLMTHSVFQHSKNIALEKPISEGWNVFGSNGPIVDIAVDEFGAYQAAAMTRSWHRGELIFCYVILALLSNLICVHRAMHPIALKNGIHEVMKNEIRYLIEESHSEEDYYTREFVWQPHISLLLMTITGILGYMIFARLCNVYSRPRCLFIGSLGCVGGLMMTASSEWLSSYTIGAMITAFSSTGLQAVISIIVADITDLRHRTMFLWYLECTVWLWSGLSGWFQDMIKRNWRDATWVYNGCVMLLTIPNLVAFYIYIRRAKRRGFVPLVLRKSYTCSIFNPRTMATKVAELFSINDICGILTWSISVLSIASSACVSSWTMLGEIRGFFLASGIAFLIFFVAWEAYLHVYNQRMIQLESHVDSDIPHSNTPIAVLSIRNNAPSKELDDIAEKIARRLKNRDHECKTEGIMFPISLFLGGDLVLLLLCVGLESFSGPLNSWILHGTPAALIKIKWQHMYFTVHELAYSFGGLVAAITIVRVKRLKYVIIIALFIQLISALIAISTYLSNGIAYDDVYLPQILHGIGSGMCQTPLLVTVHVSCITRANIATATGLTMSIRMLSYICGHAACQKIRDVFFLGEPFEFDDKFYHDSQRMVQEMWGYLGAVNAMVLTIALAIVVAGIRDVG